MSNFNYHPEDAYGTFWICDENYKSQWTEVRNELLKLGFEDFNPANYPKDIKPCGDHNMIKKVGDIYFTIANGSEYSLVFSFDIIVPNPNDPDGNYWKEYRVFDDFNNYLLEEIIKHDNIDEISEEFFIKDVDTWTEPRES